MSDDFTQKLSNWYDGDQDALKDIVPVVMEELKRQARRYMQREKQDHTLQATSLVNEAFIRLVDVNVSWQNRAHFFAIAAKMMRRILVDHARQKDSFKRGGQYMHTSLDGHVIADPAGITHLVFIDDLLQEFESFDERAASYFEQHFFAGMTVKEIAEVGGISESTVARELSLAKSWLTSRLKNY